jgi:hypothetical protein
MRLGSIPTQVIFGCERRCCGFTVELEVFEITRSLNVAFHWTVISRRTGLPGMELVSSFPSSIIGTPFTST